MWFIDSCAKFSDIMPHMIPSDKSDWLINMKKRYNYFVEKENKTMMNTIIAARFIKKREQKKAQPRNIMGGQKRRIRTT